MAIRVIAKIYLTLNPNKYSSDTGVQIPAAAAGLPLLCSACLPLSRTLHEEAIILAGRN